MIDICPAGRGLKSSVVAFLILQVPLAASAQTPDTLRQDTVYELEPIGVQAVRPSTTAGGVSAVVLRLDSVRLRPAPLLEDVLRALPLVQVRSNSRGEAQLALRGAKERQVAILLDGVPVTLGWDHRTDLSVVPLTAARSVTLIRGLSTVLHGPNVLGGAVEIGLASASDSRPDPLTVAAGLDQRGGYSVAVQTGTSADLRGGRLVVRAGAGHRDREGFPVPDDGVEAVYPALAAGDLRVNSHARVSDGFVTVRYGGGGAWVAATGTAYGAERGVPPELTEAAPRLWRYPSQARTIGILTGGTGAMDTPAGSGELRFSLGLDAGRTEIHDFAVPEEPASGARTTRDFFTILDETEASEGRTLTARVLGEHSLGARTRLRAAVTYAGIDRDEVITTGIATGAPAEAAARYRQRLWSVGGELERPLTGGLLGPITGGRISGGLVWDAADSPVTGGAGEGPTLGEWGARVGLSGTTRGAGLLLHAAASRRGRFPSLREMYSTALGRFEPNHGLRPEILTALEAGFTGNRGPLDLQVVAFHQRLGDAIVRGAAPSRSDARFQRVNRDEIRSTGIELLGGYTRGRFVLETELTVQDVEAIVREDGASVPVRAEYEPEMAGGVGGTFPLPLRLEGDVEVEVVGRQYCATPVNEQEIYSELDASTRADLEVARSFRLGQRIAGFERVGMELAVENLTDSAIYDQCGLPRPGRTLRLQVRVN
ncbi:MAG TPA: TonB-dependent receptor [Longimicrobiales bacterium]|nr:TonB-dependent receptor [Longimicrobiales bacterium]